MNARYVVGTLLVTMAAGCAPTPIPEQSPVQSSMFRHFALARDMRTFAVSGETERLRDAAYGLSEAEETWGLPPGSNAYLDRIRQTALRAFEATTMAEAHEATAEVARTCGDCHLANQVDLGSRFVTVQPLANGSVTRHMNRLSWVSRLLWDGLVGPSERTWSTGSGALVGASDFPPPTAQHVPEAILGASAELWRRWAQKRPPRRTPESGFVSWRVSGVSAPTAMRRRESAEAQPSAATASRTSSKGGTTSASSVTQA